MIPNNDPFDWFSLSCKWVMASVACHDVPTATSFIDGYFIRRRLLYSSTATSFIDGYSATSFDGTLDGTLEGRNTSDSDPLFDADKAAEPAGGDDDPGGVDPPDVDGLLDTSGWFWLMAIVILYLVTPGGKIPKLIKYAISVHKKINQR